MSSSTMPRRAAIRVLFSLLLTLTILAPLPGAASAQIEQGATMTVLRGQVAVIRGDGSAQQPAPSGTVVYAGDEIRTLDPGGALVTFFFGTELELAEGTAIQIEQAERDGSRITISLKQAFGRTISRVETFAHPGSIYRVETGGAVALVRG